MHGRTASYFVVAIVALAFGAGGGVWLTRLVDDTPAGATATVAGEHAETIGTPLAAKGPRKNKCSS